MRIVVVGGAGEVGSALSADLAQCPEVDELVIADVDGRKAGELAAAIVRPGVTSAELDIAHRSAAERVLDGADLLMNCTSFALFDEVLDVALTTGVNYADLISEPTAHQREAAGRAGITAVSGLGLTPGLSNILVTHAAQELDELEEVHINWISLRTIAPSPGGLNTILWELADACPTRQIFQNGRWHHVRSMEGSRTVEFAAPIGPQRVYFVPHTEVHTLPRRFPSLRYCAVRGTWRPELMDDIRVLNKYGLLERDAFDATRAQILERFGGVRDDAPWPLFLNVEVIGSQGGETVRRVYDVSHPIGWGQEGMARMTGTCAAVGAQLLGRHGTRGAGFVDPEAYYDPGEFLVELERRGGITVEWTQQPLSGAAAERPT